MSTRTCNEALCPTTTLSLYCTILRTILERCFNRRERLGVLRLFEEDVQ